VSSHRPDHPPTATGLSNLASLLKAQGVYDEARPLYDRALRIHETVLGPDHPWTATSLNNLALLEADLGETPAAFSRSRVALVASVGHYSRVAWSWSESERLRFLRTLAWYGEVVLSFARRLEEEGAPEAAYATVVDGKGRVARGLLRAGLRAVGALPEEERALVRRLRSLQQRLSDAVYAAEVADPEGHAQRLERLREERNALEVDTTSLINARSSDRVALSKMAENVWSRA
jgi:tetratricopeptide (TPR) repeat protein